MRKAQGSRIAHVLGVAQHMEQLPHIARPVIRPQQVVDLLFHIGDCVDMLIRGGVQVVLYQFLQIVQCSRSGGGPIITVDSR